MPGFVDNLMQALGQIGSEMYPGYGPQVAQIMSDNNPYRPVLNRASLMGVPTLNAIDLAANWETQQRNTGLAEQQHKLQEQQFTANTVNVTPEMLQQFRGYSPDNLNAHLPLSGARYLNDLAAINSREEVLRQSDKTKAAQTSILSGMQPYLQQLQATPQGAMTANALQNPDAFTSEQWGGLYNQTGGIVQGGINREALSKALGDVVGSMQGGATKQMLQQLLPLVRLEGMDGVGTQIAGSALGSVQKPLTPMEQAEASYKNAQAYRLLHPVFAPDRSGDGENTFGSLGFGSNKQAESFIKNINSAYGLEMKKNGGRLTTTPEGEKWIFPSGKPTPSVGTWVNSKFGEQAYRKYMALMTGNQEFADNNRTLFSVTNPGIIQNDYDVQADQYLKQLGLGSLTQTIDQSISDPKVDPNIVAALLKRYKTVFKKDYVYGGSRRSKGKKNVKK